MHWIHGSREMCACVSVEVHVIHIQIYALSTAHMRLTHNGFNYSDSLSPHIYEEHINN